MNDLDLDLSWILSQHDDMGDGRALSTYDDALMLWVLTEADPKLALQGYEMLKAKELKLPHVGLAFLHAQKHDLLLRWMSDHADTKPYTWVYEHPDGHDIPFWRHVLLLGNQEACQMLSDLGWVPLTTTVTFKPFDRRSQYFWTEQPQTPLIDLVYQLSRVHRLERCPGLAYLQQLPGVCDTTKQRTELLFAWSFFEPEGARARNDLFRAQAILELLKEGADVDVPQTLKFASSKDEEGVPWLWETTSAALLMEEAFKCLQESREESPVRQAWLKILDMVMAQTDPKKWPPPTGLDQNPYQKRWAQYWDREKYAISKMQHEHWSVPEERIRRLASLFMDVPKAFTTQDFMGKTLMLLLNQTMSSEQHTDDKEEKFK